MRNGPSQGLAGAGIPITPGRPGAGSNLFNTIRSHARRFKYRPDSGAAVAADLTSKPRLQVGQANVIAPAAGVDNDRMRTFVIAAIGR
jgi:hypothetical protein